MEPGNAREPWQPPSAPTFASANAWHQNILRRHAKAFLVALWRAGYRLFAGFGAKRWTRFLSKAPFWSVERLSSLEDSREEDSSIFSGRVRLHRGGPCRRALGYPGSGQAASRTESGAGEAPRGS